MDSVPSAGFFSLTFLFPFFLGNTFMARWFVASHPVKYTFYVNLHVKISLLIV